MQWQNAEYPQDGTWCWVTGGDAPWIAMHDSRAAGGWTNADTWEDWGHDITHWIPLETPLSLVEEVRNAAKYESVDLEKFRLTVVSQIERALIDDFAMQPIVDLSTHAWFSRDAIAVRVKQEVYGETLGTLEVKHPATWFQMLKEQHAPYWLKRRWPVRYDVQKYDARALYPLVSLPDETHNRTWVKKYTETQP